MIYRLLCNLLSLIDRKLIYKFAYWWTRLSGLQYHFNQKPYHLPISQTKAMGLIFPNPIGIGAGFDRDGKLIKSLSYIGFGSIEIGTININSKNKTWNESSNIKQRLQKSNAQSVVGVNIGSEEKTLDERTTTDFLVGMESFWLHADYIVINLSRPGSPTRAACLNSTENDMLHSMMQKIKYQQKQLIQLYSKQTPVSIKIAIEYKNKDKLVNILTIAKDLDFDGILVSFEHWPSNKEITKYVQEIATLIQPLPLIAVGGIQSAQDAKQILEAGAILVQLYTSLVEQGPSKIRGMINKLANLTAKKM